MNFSIGSNRSTMINSLMDDEGNGPTAKKRKLSTSSNPLTRIQAEVLQFENEKLCNEIEKLDKENQYLMDQCEKYKKEAIEVKDTVTTLQAAAADLQEHSTANAAKIKTLEDEKQKLEAKIKELETEHSSMKTIKSEIKDTVEGEREASRTTIDKINAEIKGLKNKNGMLNKEKQKLRDAYEKDTEEWQQQKEVSEKAFKHLRNKNDFNEKMAEKEKQNFEAGIKEMEAEILSMKINVSKTKKDIVEVQRKRVADAVEKLMKLKDETNATLKNYLQSPDALFTKSLSLHQKLLLRSIIQEIRATALKELDFTAVYDCYRRNCLSSSLDPLEMCSTNGLLSSLKSMGYIDIKVYGLVFRRITFKMNFAEIEYLLKQY